ncbi:MAG: thioredoxin-disulfide reductase [bacterium]
MGFDSGLQPGEGSPKAREYEIIIVGAGPAGLTAGIYTGRARIPTLLIEKGGAGGQALLADWIENYPGFPKGISGSDLMSQMEEQALKFGLKRISEEVTGLMERADKKGWVVKTAAGEYKTLAVIIAAGAQPAKLGVPGEDELRGKGVSYCATCDGFFFKDREIAVVGGGDTAVTEALFLTRFVSKLTIIHRRDRLRAAKILQERALNHPKIDFAWNSVVTEILGDERLAGVRIKDVKTGREKTLSLSGVFIFTGLRPNSHFLTNLIDLDEGGYIITNEKMETSRGGIFACGDIRSGVFRQITTACGDGTVAALSAQHYVEELFR